jgi:branched-chain amino acid transport system substrate-binding protein
MTSHLTAVLVAAATAGAASTGCARPAASSAHASDTLYIGVAAARGSLAYFRGAQLALDRFNGDRPTGSPPLALRLPPDSQPSQVSIAARFRDDPSVVGVVGHTGSAQTMDAAPVYGDVENGGRNGVVAITPTATNPEVTRVSQWIFRVCPTDEDAARALAHFAIDSLRARRVAIVYRNDLFGRGFTRTIAPELGARSVAIIERDPYLTGITEYQAYAARIARGGADAIIFAGGGTDAADLVRALHALGINAAILGTDDVGNILDGVKTMEPAPNRQQANVAANRRPTARDRQPVAAPTDDRELFRGVRFTAFYDPARASTDEERYFAAEYRRRYGQAPTHQAALSYDAAMLISHAVSAVGRDRRRIRDWIASVGRDAPAQRGITGEIRFDDHGDALGKAVLIGTIRP